jgi:hypothetical protein
VETIPLIEAELPDELATEALDELGQYFSLMGREAPSFDEPSEFRAEALSYQIASVLKIDASARQELLEIDDPIDRLQAGLKLMRQERAFLKLLGESNGGDNSIGPFSRN